LESIAVITLRQTYISTSYTHTVHHIKSLFLTTPLCQRLKESNYNKCSKTEKMSPITSHRECWVSGMLLFMCSGWTSVPIIQLSWTYLHFLTVCHQSVTAVVSGNQCNSGQLKRDSEGGTSLYSIMGNKAAACFLSKRFLLYSVFLFFFSYLSLYWIFDTKKRQRRAAEGRRAV